MQHDIPNDQKYNQEITNIKLERHTHKKKTYFLLHSQFRSQIPVNLEDFADEKLFHADRNAEETHEKKKMLACVAESF